MTVGISACSVKVAIVRSGTDVKRGGNGAGFVHRGSVMLEQVWGMST